MIMLLVKSWPGRAALTLGGLAAITFGAVLCARRGIGAITLALLFGLFNLITGTWALAHGIELHRTGKNFDTARTRRDKAAASTRP